MTTYRRRLLRLTLYPALQLMGVMPVRAPAAVLDLLDAPGATAVIGATGARGTTGTTGATGASDAPRPTLSTALLLPLAPTDAQQALLAVVAQLPATHPRRRRYRLAIPFGAPLFPPDHLLQPTPGQQADAGLVAWLALPPDQRRHDVLLLPDEDYYWREPGDTAGDYSAQWIVHLAEDRVAGTALSIVQAHARRRRGKSFHLLGRTGPGLYWNITPTTPSTAAAATLAADLAQWLSAMHQGA